MGEKDVSPETRTVHDKNAALEEQRNTDAGTTSRKNCETSDADMAKKMQTPRLEDLAANEHHLSVEIEEAVLSGTAGNFRDISGCQMEKKETRYKTEYGVSSEVIGVG